MKRPRQDTLKPSQSNENVFLGVGFKKFQRFQKVSKWFSYLEQNTQFQAIPTKANFIFPRLRSISMVGGKFGKESGQKGSGHSALNPVPPKKMVLYGKTVNRNYL